MPIRRALTSLALALVLLTGCTEPPSPERAQPQAPRPAPPPTDLRTDPQPAAVSPPRSARSRAMADYYRRLQNDLLTRGLLRADGGGPDTPFTDTMLVRNFRRIALEEEYVRGEGLRPSAGGASAVKKWTDPIRVTVEFGPSVSAATAVADRNELIAYVRRLRDITGHPIQLSDWKPNFHVLFMSEDDADLIAPRIREIVPDVNPRALSLFDALPRAIHCLVIAFAKDAGGYEYGTAIAVIRDEHPDLLRRSCIHEEIAQGLGLANDSPQARPSIFNDDDEFALLTEHDEMLLRLLYDPALKAGMRSDEALPIVRRRAAQLMDGSG